MGPIYCDGTCPADDFGGYLELGYGRDLRFAPFDRAEQLEDWTGQLEGFGWNPFKAIGKAVGGVAKGVGKLVGKVAAPALSLIPGGGIIRTGAELVAGQLFKPGAPKPATVAPSILVAGIPGTVLKLRAEMLKRQAAAAQAKGDAAAAAELARKAAATADVAERLPAPGAVAPPATFPTFPEPGPGYGPAPAAPAAPAGFDLAKLAIPAALVVGAVLLSRRPAAPARG